MNAARLYAHAIAIEREAAARYSEFAVRMAELGNELAAEIFATLARMESEHLDALLRRTAGMELPAPRELASRVLSPRQALEIALACERAAGEAEHIVILEKLLEKSPSPVLDWAPV